MKILRFLLLALATLFTNLSFAGVLAYVTNLGDATVSVIDTVSNTVIATIPVGGSPAGIVIIPSGTKAYVANFADGTVTVINTLTNTVLGAPITVGLGPLGIAVTPDGTTVYVVNQTDSTVTDINTATDTVLSTILGGGTIVGLSDIAITLDGTIAIVTNQFNSNISFISIPGNVVTGPTAVAVAHPNVATTTVPVLGILTKKAYVSNQALGSISVLNAATKAVIAGPIAMGAGAQPRDIAITPDLTRDYVCNSNNSTVEIINTLTDVVVGVPIVMPGNPATIAITPDGTKAYVTIPSTDSVSIIDIATNTVIDSPIPVGDNPFFGIAISFVPLEGSGFCKKDRFFTETDFFNVITWGPLTSSIPIQYNVFRDGQFIASVPANDRRRFEDHNRKKNRTYIYTIVAEDGISSISLGSVSIKSCN